MLFANNCGIFSFPLHLGLCFNYFAMYTKQYKNSNISK